MNMLKTIELKKIKPNPFNARSDYDEGPINELAKEIESEGFWTGALRGRMKDGQVELCFGHRRLAALRKLHYKEIPVEIIELSDEDMAMQGLAENLQRQGLNDMEKADGIKQMADLLSKNEQSKESVYQKIATKLGYQSTSSIKELLAATSYSAPVKKRIRQKKIKIHVAKVAMRLGGDRGEEMVETAIREELSHHTIAKLAQALDEIPDEKVKEKIKAQVVTGKITDPKEIAKKAEPMLRTKAEKGKPPPDLNIVIAHWTISIKDWRKALREVIPYRDYLDTSPRTAKEFREEVSGLIAELEKLL